MSGILLIGWAPWEKKPGGEIVRNILPQISQKYPRHRICLLFEGSTSETPAGTSAGCFYYGFSWDVENETVRGCYNNRGFFAAVFLLVKKIITKTNRHFFHVCFQRSEINRIIKKERICHILCLTEWTNVRVDALPALKHRLIGSVFLSELPVRFRYTKKEALNKHAIINTLKKGYKIFAPQDDVDLISKYVRHPSIRPLEYPLYVRCDCSQKRAKGNLLLYFGSFYPTIRNPKELFALLKQMPDYELHIYGAERDPYEPVPTNCFFHSRVDKGALEEIVKSASALVNIENTNTILSSSKLVSLLSYHRPILSFGTRASLANELVGYGLFFDALKSDGQLKDASEIKNWLMTVSGVRSDGNFDEVMNRFSPCFFVNTIFK